MAINISKGLLDQVENRKHALVSWATREGKLEDSAYLNTVKVINNLIKTFGGNPKDTEPTEEAVQQSKSISSGIKDSLIASSASIRVDIKRIR